MHLDTLVIPYTWCSPRLVVVNSTSDLFHPDVPLDFIRQVLEVMANTPQHTYQILTERSRVSGELDWPDNVWMGVSVESARYAFRIDHVRHVGASVRFVSAEPLLGALPEVDLTGIDWLIGGGESGSRARPVEETWLIDLRERCSAAQVPFFSKPWGDRTPNAGGRDLVGSAHDEMPQRNVALT
ncbi:MAG: DUF5131 family protein [bacterium]|nr:DUF5131 family protein [bacterium]